MRTNYIGTLEMVRAFVPLLEDKKEAAIVNVASIAAFTNFPIIGGYSASKAALFSLSQAIRIELAEKGIAVHTVNPGPIDTELAKEFPTDKAGTDETATDLLDKFEAGEADIFPDEQGREMFSVWKNDYRDLEQMVFEMYKAA